MLKALPNHVPSFYYNLVKLGLRLSNSELVKDYVMTNQPSSAIWHIYRDITASLPNQRDPRVASASRRFIMAFHADLESGKEGHLSAIANLNPDQNSLPQKGQ